MTGKTTRVQHPEWQSILLLLAICGALPAHYGQRAGNEYSSNVLDMIVFLCG